MSDLNDQHHHDILRRAFAEEAAACGDPTTARLMLAMSAAYGRAAIEVATNRAAFAALLASAPEPAAPSESGGRQAGTTGAQA